MPTWKEHGCVPVHVAVQSMPQAAVQPPVPVQATAQWSPHVVVQGSVLVQEQLVETQTQPTPKRPPPLQLGEPPGLGPELQAIMRALVPKTIARRVMSIGIIVLWSPAESFLLRPR